MTVLSEGRPRARRVRPTWVVTWVALGLLAWFWVLGLIVCLAWLRERL